MTDPRDARTANAEDTVLQLYYENRRIRNETIEECAKVAQQWLISAEQGSGEDLIDAIQALKGRQ